MNKLNSNPFFSEQGIETLVKKLQEGDYSSKIERNNLLLYLIMAKQPISQYELAKLSGLSYNTVKMICRFAKASEFILSKVSVGENGLPVKLVFISGEK